jgi:hydroxymethylpyrimidine pyrophosphatase-like HAD family hydrolase
MAKNIIAALKLKDPCVISGGTQIINPISGEILWEVTLKPIDVKTIIEICTPYEYEVLMRNELLGEGGTAKNRKDITEEVNVVYIMGCDKTDAETILAELNKLDDITAVGVTSWTNEKVDVHVTNRLATKEHAVAELLNLLALKKQEVIGVGDADNDVHLFASVGYKVAMGNATSKLKALANEITSSVDDDGLVDTLNKYS